MSFPNVTLVILFFLMETKIAFQTRSCQHRTRTDKVTPKSRSRAHDPLACPGRRSRRGGRGCLGLSGCGDPTTAQLLPQAAGQAGPARPAPQSPSRTCSSAGLPGRTAAHGCLRPCCGTALDTTHLPRWSLETAMTCVLQGPAPGPGDSRIKACPEHQSLAGRWVSCELVPHMCGAGGKLCSVFCEPQEQKRCPSYRGCHLNPGQVRRLTCPRGTGDAGAAEPREEE